MGTRVWQASWPMLLLAVAACALFIVLGRWQWQRGEYRSAQWASFASTDTAPRDADATQIGTLPRFTRIRLRGRFDGEHQFLLDNISEGGRAGYYVVTPLLTEAGPAVLVNRGWLPGTGYRERLPDVTVPADPTPRTITGRIGALPAAGIAAGRMPPADGPWPRVASFPDEAQLAAALPYPVARGIVLLDDAPGEPELVRNWRPPGLDPNRHYAYAVQWWAFAVLAVVLLAALNFRRKPR
jgi:cytochrome oxidase assembly protein ShyY1